MAGIYIHIPFCKQACHYCDFHFSTSLKYKDQMVDAICKEILNRKDEHQEIIETIYFGGGTPSLLTSTQIQKILQTVYTNYSVVENPEVTLEANPDDLSEKKILELSKTQINRLSIGIQSIFEEDLKMMNRAHNATESIKCLELAKKYFQNISVDLIYGIPNMTLQQWEQNIDFMLNLNIPHISCYALTVEAKTALEKLIATGKIPNTDEAQAHAHFLFLIDKLQKAGYDHYEMSNFGKPGFESKNNTAYWLGKKYLGIGPSAHSFNGKERSWNIANNIIYIKNIENNLPTAETESLTLTDRYNEYIMTGLRTKWGVNLEYIETEFGKTFVEYVIKEAQPFLKKNHLSLNNSILTTTNEGKFFGDGISSNLFKVD